MEKSVYEFKVLDHKGNEFSLDSLRGKVLLVVNTASRCGFTPQYTGLEALHKEFQEDLKILAFPCNQFGSQEPGTNEEIQAFCSLNFGLSFPVMGKIQVNGSEADPLFVYLKEALPGIAGSTTIKWNFTKFLLDKEGQPIKRFAPQDTPESLHSHIEALL